MSKLDRFFVSNNLLNIFPHISGITLDRFLSDHRPILLRESAHDYGPVPFRFFHHWIHLEGFNDFVTSTWNSAPSVDSNGMRNLAGKLKFLKAHIKIWIKDNKSETVSTIANLKKELNQLDAVIDKGTGTEVEAEKRMEVLAALRNIDHIHSMDLAQKAKIKWSIEGDENSNFFHGILNKKRNQMNIRGITIDGVWKEQPNDVKQEFLSHFQDRFAKPSERRANIDMRFPKTISEDQSQDLEREVSKQEIKTAVWGCGTDKSPGPDGFSFGFYRHFWPVIEHDVYMAVNHFFIHGEIPPGCNSSFIALIPKVPDANLVKDFRPISLIGSIYKIIAKILSNRLVNVLGDIVNEVQSAFIAERQMLDGPFILNEILQWCTKKKKKTLIFKVDFEKAFDSIRWDFLDDVLKEFGFRCKWRNWIQSCLTSSKGSILVNGCPTNEFQFYKGLKQGDPLSPFLFILVMESLHLSFQRIVNAGMFKGIVLDQSLCLSHMFYADDAIFLGEWSDGNISTLIHVLKCFFHASGLKINLNKSKIMGINVESAQVIQAAAKLGCLVLKCPFYYLGTRVGGSMTRVQAWQEIVEKVKSRLSKWKSKTLSIGGRLTLLKSVLGSIPVFHMSIFKVPSKVLHILESIRSHFFNGHDPGSKKASWVKWNNVLTDKKRGGLGVSSLFALNRGLMIKWVWKFLSQKDSLWTKVIVAIHGVGGKIHSEWTSTGKSCWLSILSEVRSLQRKGMYVFDYLTHKMGNGESTKFWLDHWHTRGIFKDIFPRLYALESSKDVTVSSKIGDTSLVCSFRRIPRGGIEQNQFDSLVELVRSVTIVPSADRWNWNLESTGIFSVASARRRIDEICLPNIGEETRWVKCVPIKINVLAWKIKTDALPTRFNISRRGIDIQDMSCPICDNAIESTDHLFFRCGLVRDIANKVLSWWNLDHANLNSYAEWKSLLVSIRMDSNLKKMFEGVWYSIWWLDGVVHPTSPDIRFWKDLWIGDCTLSGLFPRLFALDTEKDISVAGKLQSPLVSSFRRNVRGGIEEQQLEHLVALLDSVILSNSNDRWVSDLNGDGVFRVKDVRNLLDEFFLPRADIPTRWVKNIPIKVNIFAWKLALDRLPTRANLVQRNVVTESQSCPLCDAILEDTSHLFFNCSLARDVTRLLCRWWNLGVQSFSSYAEWLVWFNSVRLASNLKVILEGVFYVTWWSLWNFRNQLLFASKKPRKESIFDDIVLRSFCWCKARGSSKLRWDSWIQHPYLISL
ncbi:RNA-directed DNA polymerase, eukaryota [Tanacetum coccineum]